MEEIPMKELFLILYIVISCIHLYHSWMDDTKRRPYTKPVLLLLMAYYAVAADQISWILMLALFTSWLGDVLLIPKGHKWFMIGGTAFLISHFLFMASYIPHVQWNAVPWLIIVAAAAVYFGISFCIIKAIRPTTPAKMVWPMARYLIINSSMNLFALMRLLSVVIKYGMILDKELYGTLHSLPFDRDAVVTRCVEIKRDVVQQDEFDNGIRGLLNFGHTFGHAIEKLSDFGVSHGAAVAKGMVIAARLAPLCGLCDVADELSALLLEYGFDISCPYGADEIYDALLSDKKRRGGNISVVLPRATGDCTLVTLPVEELENLLHKVLG